MIDHGRIVGDVVLGDGADTFVFGKGGTVAGDLFLGGGDDFVLIENGAGKTNIADFAAGATGGDVIDVSEFFSTFAALFGASSQVDGDVVIVLDANDVSVVRDFETTSGSN